MTKQELIAHFGSTRAVADVFGITLQAFYQWPETIPKGRAYEAEVKTAGALRAEASQDGRSTGNKDVRVEAG